MLTIPRRIAMRAHVSLARAAKVPSPCRPFSIPTSLPGCFSHLTSRYWHPIPQSSNRNAERVLNCYQNPNQPHWILLPHLILTCFSLPEVNGCEMPAPSPPPVPTPGITLRSKSPSPLPSPSPLLSSSPLILLSLPFHSYTSANSILTLCTLSSPQLPLPKPLVLWSLCIPVLHRRSVFLLYR